MNVDAYIEEVANDMMESFMENYMPPEGRFTERQIKSSVPYFAEWNERRTAALEEISRAIAKEYVVYQVIEQQMQIANALAAFGGKQSKGFFESIIDNVTKMAESNYKNEIDNLAKKTFAIFTASLGLPVGI